VRWSAEKPPTCLTFTSLGDFDIAGFIVGVAERDALLDGSRIVRGDVLPALPSKGLHTYGYSLVRSVFDVAQGRRRA